MNEIERNPFVETLPQPLALIRLEILMLRTQCVHSEGWWLRTLKQADRILSTMVDFRMMAAAIIIQMDLVRDEYSCFPVQKRMKRIRELIQRIDNCIIKEKESGGNSETMSVLFSTKSSLIRWNGRQDRGDVRSKIYAEAERCAEKSLELNWSHAGFLQLGLSKFDKSRSMPAHLVRQFRENHEDAIKIISNHSLDNFSASIKYRPIYFRHIYEYKRSIECFWKAVDFGFYREMQKISFVLGESTLSDNLIADDRLAKLHEVNGFIADAIAAGFDHGRNIMSWISTRAALEPDWFKFEVLSRIEDKNERSELSSILNDVSKRYLDCRDSTHDILFGVDDVNFWNSLARICRTTLDDPQHALKFLQRAERHAGRPGGDFTTKVGFVRTFLQIGKLPDAQRYLNMAKDTAFAFQLQIVNALRSEVRASRAS